MKKQGKVITISLKSLSEGMQVYWDGCPSKVKLWHVLKIKPTIVEVCPLSEKLYPVRAQSPLPDELKTLVVEYDAEKKNYLDVDNTFEKKYKTLQLPLKYSQWQSAIDNGEVDSDKVVEFETINELKKEIAIGKPLITIAKIIPQKKRMRLG